PAGRVPRLRPSYCNDQAGMRKIKSAYEKRQSRFRQLQAEFSLQGGQLEAIFREQAHRRLNPLTSDWVLVSPHRTQRPGQGAIEALPASERPRYDPTCYLCPRNQRAGGVRNPDYQSTFLFENDFAALKKDAPRAQLDVEQKGLLVAETEQGICRVM